MNESAQFSKEDIGTIKEFLSNPQLYDEILTLARSSSGFQINGYSLSSIDDNLQTVSLDITYEATYDNSDVCLEYDCIENSDGVGSNEDDYFENASVAHVSIDGVTGLRSLLNDILLKKIILTGLNIPPSPTIKHRF